jgi:1,4-alpha-glucan branching enzyme
MKPEPERESRRKDGRDRRPAAPPPKPAWSRIGSIDLHLFNEGTHTRLYEKLGAHPATYEGEDGVCFAVWAPNAVEVSVIGDWNYWSGIADPLAPRGTSGIWEGFVPSARAGQHYKYRIRSRDRDYSVDKADPFGLRFEAPPRTASIVHAPGERFEDAAWMASRRERMSLSAPMSIYEVHLGSFRRADGDRRLTYRELAAELVPYVREMGFTHVELMPVMEHPFYGSWGYQVTGYFAPTARYGTPEDFAALVDALHQNDIGVILDWVPAHFPTDEHALAYFDGTHLFEHADPRKGFHPDWQSAIFNYGRNEVRSFLLSSAHFWLDRFHADGLRVDGVASMLYLDYSRKEGEWIPNVHGGRENLDAISFLKEMNEGVYRDYPDVQTIAEESTAFGGVSRPTFTGGLGFGLKWDMGWMHDTLRYLKRDPVHRRHHQNELTFRALYAFTENFVLPLSHDEVVHGKGSLLGQMAGDDWQKFANLRLLFAYMFTQPGKKLLFMGDEIAQWREWSHDQSVDWHLLDFPMHRGVQALVRALNRLYREEPALHRLDCEPSGFAWLDADNAAESVLVYERRAERGHPIIAALNFTPVPRHFYRVGVDRGGFYEELLNTDAMEYGGSGQGNFGRVEAHPVPWHGRRFSLAITLPPLGAVVFRAEGENEPRGTTGSHPPRG